MQLSPQSACEILVIEDDHAIRQVLTQILGDDGCHVQCAVHGQDALEYLDQAAQLPQLILLDLMMPTMDGFTFRSHQRQHPRLRDIPVVLLSAITINLDPRQCAALDAVAFLAKPIDWAHLDRVVAQYCACSD